MSGIDPSAGPGDRRNLVTALEPALRDACRGGLGPVQWFKADWQRGGAATGWADYATPGGPMPVVVKLPVPGRELLWTRRLQPSAVGADSCPFTAADDDGQAVADLADPVGLAEAPRDLCVPRLVASGVELAGYHVAWIVIERFEHGPLGLQWHDDHVPRVAEAIGRFHAAAASFDIDREPRREDWKHEFKDAAAAVRSHALPEPARWKKALKALRQRAGDLIEEWRSRPVTQWLHGDLHLANAMSREGVDAGAVSLIDLAEVRPGHWIEDAIFLERQLWARPERLAAAAPLRAVADARKTHGLANGSEYPRLASIRRGFLAATAPLFLKTEGHPAHLAACLEHLERSLDELR